MLVGRQKISKNFMNYNKWYYKKLHSGREELGRGKSLILRELSEKASEEVAFR